MKAEASQSIRQHRRFRRAFTLLELLIVIVMIAILLGVTAPTLKVVLRSSAIDSGQNTVSSALAGARALALREGRDTAVIFSHDPNAANTTLVRLVIRNDDNGATAPDAGFLTTAGGNPDFGFRPIDDKAPDRLPAWIRIAGPDFTIGYSIASYTAAGASGATTADTFWRLPNNTDTNGGAITRANVSALGVVTGSLPTPLFGGAAGFYSAAPAVAFLGRGSGAAATATLSGGSVTSFTITSAGSNYNPNSTPLMVCPGLFSTASTARTDLCVWFGPDGAVRTSDPATGSRKVYFDAKDGTPNKLDNINAPFGDRLLTPIPFLVIYDRRDMTEYSELDDEDNPGCSIRGTWINANDPSAAGQPRLLVFNRYAGTLMRKK